MPLKVYLAAPLFCEAELDYNKKLADKLENEGFDVLLPQELETGVADLVRARPEDAYKEVFKMDLEALMSCDILVMVMDEIGRASCRERV